MPRTCDAYPDGIPVEILQGADHRTARRNERGGLTFDRAAGSDADRAWQWWLRFSRRRPPDSPSLSAA
jgi:hypothetical protein